VTRHLLVIGAQRCGTTYLTRLLDAHPCIAMARPARPEPKVFLSDEAAGRGLAWYESTYFSHASSEPLFGEKSTSYIEIPEAAARALAMLGDAEVVAQLRDPVARAVSNWRLSTEHGLEDRPLADALADNADGPRPWDPAVTSVSPFAYLERGRYIRQLQTWFRLFGSGVHVTFLEDLVERPESIGDVYASLGVDPRYRPRAVGRVNRSVGDPPVELPPSLLARLREYFRDSDERLQECLGRRLPWVANP
jgi:hypothetical protein